MTLPSPASKTPSSATTVTNTLTIFLGGIAGISLVVGGIGIMNIMLTTVSERTREIGLRKAIGARREDILLQFLVESMVLSLLGGMIGIILGWGIARLMGRCSWAATPSPPSWAWTACSWRPCSRWRSGCSLASTRPPAPPACSRWKPCATNKIE